MCALCTRRETLEQILLYSLLHCSVHTEEFIKTNANQCKTHTRRPAHSFNHLSIINMALPLHLLSSSANEFSVFLLMILLLQKDGGCMCALVTYSLIKAHYHLMLHWYERVESLCVYVCVGWSDFFVFQCIFTRFYQIYSFFFQVGSWRNNNENKLWLWSEGVLALCSFKV